MRAYALVALVVLLPCSSIASGSHRAMHREFWSLRREAMRTLHRIMRGDHVSDRERARLRYIRKRTDTIINAERSGDF